MNHTVENRIHFGVPIFEYQLPEYPAIQADLVSHLESLQTDDPGVVRSNQDGWHSSDQLHKDETPVIRELLTRLFTVAAECIRHHQGNTQSNMTVQLTNCWANITNSGGWNAPHNHFPRAWSAVFYVSVNENRPMKHNAIQDGDIVFFDPMPLSYSMGRAPTISYPPKNGLMYLFPAYLLHMVAPHYDKQPRISLAFNFDLVPTTTNADN